MDAHQKKAVRGVLLDLVHAFYEKQNPTKEEYLYLDLALRLSGAFGDIDCVWIRWGSVAFRNGWESEIDKLTWYMFIQNRSGRRSNGMGKKKTDPDFVDFGDVAREKCGDQCQYVSRYVDGRHGSPKLGDGLRFKGDPVDYHFLTIHKDDVETFVQRVMAHKREMG
jgi:hypothetical protein